MAVYNGREVQVFPLPRNTYEPTENVQVIDKQGQTYIVKVGQVQFTEDERKNMQVETGKRFDNVQIISNEDLQKLRDSQDHKKNEERMYAQGEPKDVTIQARGATVNTVNAQQSKTIPMTKADNKSVKSTNVPTQTGPKAS